MAGPRLLAAGGGGMTHGTDPALEDALAALLPPLPRIGYIGHASGDNPARLARVTARLTAFGARVDALPADADPARAVSWLAPLDALYVGGGNTGAMLARWRETGLDLVLAAAARRGLVLAGVSAGALCWFEAILWDGAGEGFRTIPGLGVLPGSLCPHFSTEPDRAVRYRAEVLAGRLPAGIAIDDGAAVLIEGAHPLGVVSGRPGAGARRIERHRNALVETPIPALSLP